MRAGGKLYGTMPQEFATPNLARMLAAAGMDFFINVANAHLLVAYRRHNVSVTGAGCIDGNA